MFWETEAKESQGQVQSRQLSDLVKLFQNSKRDYLSANTLYYTNKSKANGARMCLLFKLMG